MAVWQSIVIRDVTDDGGKPSAQQIRPAHLFRQPDADRSNDNQLRQLKLRYQTTCTGGPYDVVGVWAINVDGSPYYLPGVINTTGLAIFFKDIGDEAGSEVVMPSITGACSFSENLTLYSTPATVGSGGTYTYPVQGNVQSGPAISGTISEGTSSEFFAGLPIALAPFTPTPLTGSMSVVDTDSPIACHQTYCVQVQVVPSGTGNSADMALSGTDGFDCNLSGTFTQEGSNAANLNVFDVSLTFTGTTCQVTGTIKGLGFESPADYLNFHPLPAHWQLSICDVSKQRGCFRVLSLNLRFAYLDVSASHRRDNCIAPQPSVSLPRIGRSWCKIRGRLT